MVRTDRCGISGVVPREIAKLDQLGRTGIDLRHRDVVLVHTLLWRLFVGCVVAMKVPPHGRERAACAALNHR